VQTTVVTAVGGIDDNGSIITPVSMQEYANPIVNPYADLVVPAPQVRQGGRPSAALFSLPLLTSY